MKKLIFLLFAVMICYIWADTIEVSGEQSGVWTSDNDYQVVSDIFVLPGSMLTIEPGTEIEFMGDHILEVTGILIAEGSEEYPILFTSGEPDPDKANWVGIYFSHSQASASVISFCTIEYATVGISCSENASMIISDNEIWECNFGISVYEASPLIESNMIYEMFYSAVHVSQDSPEVVIRNNTIYNVGGQAIGCSDYSNCLVENNTIDLSDNIGIYCYLSDSRITGNIITGGTEGIHCYSSTPIITRNLISGIGEGIYCETPSNPDIRNNTFVDCYTAITIETLSDYAYIVNNIFYSNFYGIYPFTTNYLNISNNLFWENDHDQQGAGISGLGELISINHNEDPCDIYNNVFMDPYFADPEADDFHLIASSPAINGGLSDSNHLDPDGTISDIGAYYFQLEPELARANFEADILYGSAPLQVSFTNLSSGDIDSYFWDFGNGMNSDEENPVIEYQQNGIYAVSLIVSGEGGEDSYFQDDYIEVMPELEITGNASGVWSADNLYKITGNMFVNEGETLEIEPGTKIRLMGYYTLYISGTLLAEGTETDSIMFTSAASQPFRNDWASIIFLENGSSGSILAHCIIEYSEDGIRCENSSPEITYSRISSSTFGFYCENSSPSITHNLISQISYYGIYAEDNSNLQIIDNHFSNNAISIYLIDSNSSQITGNYFINDYGYSIYCTHISSSELEISANSFLNCNSGVLLDTSEGAVHHNYFNGGESSAITLRYSDSTYIYNNTICNKESGFGCNQSEGSHIFSNIFYGTETAILTNCVLPNLEFNLFYQNVTDYEGSALNWFGEINTNNLNWDPCDAGYNIFMSPQFEDAQELNYQLSDNSPCIDAGKPDPEYNDPDGTINDIGAFYYQIAGDNEIDDIPAGKISVVNYPNPFNPSTTIEFNLPDAGECNLSIYNIKGELVKTLLSESLAAGEYAISWDGRNDNNMITASGIYFYSLKTGNQLITRRMVLLK